MADGSICGALIILTLGFKFTPSVGEEQRKVSSDGTIKTSRGAFAPRMYYDDWTPLGHGDPLKHDPTFDYVPPLLDHVHYWEGPLRTDETIISARKDPPDLDTNPRHNGFPVMPEVPPTILVPPPLPSSGISPTRPSPTTVVDVEPVHMVLHSSTTSGFPDTRTSRPTPLPWRVSNTPMQVTTMPTSQQFEAKERPFTRNSLYQQLPPVPKPQPSTLKAQPSSSIPIQQGQPFRLPQATKTPIHAKPNNNVEEKESLASLLQSLLEDVPTTTEVNLRHDLTTPPYIATTTPPPSTTSHTVTQFSPPAVPATAPLYLIIQGHSKVKTYGASKIPSIHSIPLNQLV